MIFLQKGISMGNLLTALKTTTMLNVFKEFGKMLEDLPGMLLWALSDLFFIVLDLFETLFKKFAGIDSNVLGADGESIEGDLVLYFIQSDLVQEIFFSILILSLFLLIIFTIFAIVKNQYADKQEPVSKIINGSFKALLMYLLVPVATIVCLMVGNVVLVAIDGATSTNSAGSASDMLFSAAAYNANRLRNGTPADRAEAFVEMVDNGAFVMLGIDTYIENTYGIDFSNTLEVTLFPSENMDALSEIAVLVDDAFTGAGSWENKSGSNKWNYLNVELYYRPINISYITIWVGGAFLIWVIGKITWGLISRLFKMTFYFALSPAVMATFPIDNGKAMGSWRGEMVKNGTMAFISVGVTNVLYSFLPFFNKISFFGTNGASNWVANQILKLFMYIIAFSSAKDLIGTISGWFGTGDAVKEGVATKKMVNDPLKKYTTKAFGTVGAYWGGRKDAKEHGANKLLGGLRGVWSQTGFMEKIKPYSEAYEKGEKAGAETNKKFLTTKGFLRRVEDKGRAARYAGYDVVAAENKALDVQIKELEEERNAKQKGLAKNSAAYNKIESDYEEKINKVKASAEYLKALFVNEQKALDGRQKKTEKRKASFAALDSLNSAYGQDETLMQTVFASAGITDKNSQSYKDLAKEWDKMKVGNFSGVSSIVGDDAMNAMKEERRSLADAIAENDQQRARAMYDIEQLYNSGEDNAEYLRNTLGATIGTDGKLTGTINAIKLRIAREQRAINDAEKQLKIDTDNLTVSMAAKYNTKDAKELEKIGKSAGKK